MYKTKKSYLTIFAFVVASLALYLFQELAVAAGGKGLSDLATGLTTQLKSLAGLIVMVSYVAGIGFALGGVIQFKAHKDNPTQVPLSKPIVLLAVGACLLFLPTIISSTGQTIFGGEQKSAGEFTGDQVIK